MKKQDGRSSNTRPFKYGEPKKTHALRLTDTAWTWLKQNGGADYIERSARKEKEGLSF